jgi:hypothetical protein
MVGSTTQDFVMSLDSTAAVTRIEGIGPIIASALARIRVFTISDLLRCSPNQICRAACKHVSFRQAVDFRAAASLLRIRGMTPQWAEGLVAGGVKSIEEFQRKSTREILETLRKAKRGGRIRVLPAAEQIEVMLKDAVVLHYTGSLLGTVLDVMGKPIRAAVVQFDREKQKTDVRGRFQLHRLRLGQRLPLLRISHSRFLELVVEEPGISLDSDVVSVKLYRLTKRRKNAKRVRPVVLSELNGDTLPTPTGQPFRVLPMAKSGVESGDVLMVQNIPKGRAPVTMVSRFKSFEGGQFIVRTVKIPRDELPTKLKERDHFQLVLGKLKPAHVDAEAMRKMIILRMMRREFAEQRIGRSKSNHRRALTQRISALTRKGFFSGRLIRPGTAEVQPRTGEEGDV